MPATAAPARATLTLPRDVLAAALGAVVPVLRKAASIPVVHTVLWDGASLTATDLDMTVVVPLPGPVLEDGVAVCLHGQTFANLVRTLPRGDVTVAWSATGATLTAAGDRFTLNGISAEEFPALPVVDGPTFTILASELQSVLSAVRHVIASGAVQSVARPMFTGVHFRERDGRLVVEGTDGHRLVQCVCSVEAPPAMSSCVPGPSTDRLIALLSAESDAVVTVTVEPERIAASAPNTWRWSTRLIEGPFPNVEQVIPRKNDRMVCRVKPRDWSESLARAATLADDTQSRVEIEFAQGKAVMRCQRDDRGKGQVTAAYEPVAGEGTVSVALNIDYLRELLGHIPPAEDGTLTLRIGAAKLPVLFEGRPGTLSLIVPLVDR